MSHAGARPEIDARKWLLSRAAEREIASRGRVLSPLPKEGFGSAPTVRMIRDEVEVASRIVALDAVSDPPRWLDWLIASTAAARDLLAPAQPLVIDPLLADALPHWHSRTELLAAITGVPLPYESVLLLLRDERDWLPIGTRLEAPDSTAIAARWAGCLLGRPRAGELVAIPFATLHSCGPAELSAPAALWFTARPPRSVPAGVTALSLEAAPDLRAHSWRPPASEEETLGPLQLALAIVDRAVAAMELCGSVNVDVGPQQLHGRAAKLAARTRSPVPSIVQVREGVPRIAADECASPQLESHRFDVRGRFVYYNRGRHFDAYADRRRYIPTLGCDAVPLWVPAPSAADNGVVATPAPRSDIVLPVVTWSSAPGIESVETGGAMRPTDSTTASQRKAVMPWHLCPALRIAIRGLAESRDRDREFGELTLPELAEEHGADVELRELLGAWLVARASTRLLDVLETERVRPIIVPAPQAETLPPWPDDLAGVHAYAVNARLPFDRFVIDFDYAGLAFEATDGRARLLAALVEQVGPGVRITPVIGHPQGRIEQIVTLLPTLWTPAPDARTPVEELVIGPGGEPLFNSQRVPDDFHVWAVEAQAPRSVWLADRTLAVLRMLESINVTIVTASVNRQMRRHDRNGVLHVPGIVTIEHRRTKRTIPLDDEGGRLRYRHEVIGHHKLHGEDTPIWLANQDRLVFVPGVGMVVQVWCPSYVQGPPGAPLKMKVWKLPGYVDHEDA